MSRGINFEVPCLVMQDTNLIALYNNGASGVGATLTNSGTLLPLIVDEVIIPLDGRVLVIGQNLTYENGIYICTNQGSDSIAWVLTRSTDYDTPLQIMPGDVIQIAQGAEFESTSWIQDSLVTSIGIDPITFSLYNPAASIVLPLNITFKEWASQMRINLPNITLPIPFPEELWRSWASQVVFSNNLRNVPLPTDICYPNNEDWRKWAAYFINNIYD